MESATGNPAKWQLHHGLLDYVHVPGHAPGQIVLIHKATSTLLAADVITNLRSGLGWNSAPQLIYPPPCETPCLLPSPQYEYACCMRFYQFESNCQVIKMVHQPEWKAVLYSQ